MDLIKELLMEAVNRNQIINCMKNNIVTVITYEDPSEKVENGIRTIEIYAYGLTKKGHPAIIAWLRNNKSKSLNSGKPNDRIRWRIYRLDRIKRLQNSIQKFDSSLEFVNKERPKLNLMYKNFSEIFYKIEPK